MEDAVERIRATLGEKPVFLKPGSLIPTYQQPLIDEDTLVQNPTPRRVVTGHFEIGSSGFDVQDRSPEQKATDQQVLCQLLAGLTVFTIFYPSILCCLGQRLW